MNRVFVADWRTTPVWLQHGYEGALKVIDSRRPDFLENAEAVHPGDSRWAHGWGVHQPGDDHQAVLTAARNRISYLGLRSYGMDLEDGWFYDGPWGDEHQPDENAKQQQLERLLVTAREVLGQEFPLWVCVYPLKDYGPGVFAAAHVDVVVMLYGASDPLPNPAEAWADSHDRYFASPIRPALWKGQPYPDWSGLTVPVYRFDAEIMQPEDYL